MASEYLKYKFRDVERDAPIELTTAQSRKNWWHYHKWYFIIGGVLLIILIDIGINMARQFLEAPDYRIAYVGEKALPDDTQRAIEQTFAQLGEDLDCDGRVEAELTQYIFPTKVDPEMSAASEVLLMGDVLKYDSYFFLLDDPEGFQEKYHCLCRLDGSLPADWDYSAEGTYVEWHDGLFLARRGFWTEETCKYPEGCGELWDKLTEGADK